MKNIKFIIFVYFFGVLALSAQQKKYVTYKVTEGETLQSISKKLSITPYNLLKLNPDIEKDIHVGDLLIVPNKEYNTKADLSSVDLSNIGDKDIIVDNFVYHEVAPKETIYSIIKNYNLKSDDLNKYNAFLKKEGLRPGQVIKIPLPFDLEALEEKNSKLQPYLVKPKETKYSIARNFGISIDELESLNPKIKETGLQIDDVIMVPNEIKNTNSPYTIHKIEKKETLYGLSTQFGISQEELLELNPQLKDGVKVGLLITIPNKDFNNKVFEDKILEGTSLNLAMMLPFKRKMDTLDFNNNRLLNITTDFYFGALTAIDSLKNQGLSVHMKVYDTENSAFVSKQLSQKAEFGDYDLIIGPMFLKNVKVVAKNMEGKKPLLISPLSAQDHSSIYNKNLVQEVPTTEHMANEMLRYIKSIYTGQKIVIIADVEENLTNAAKSWVKQIQNIDTLKYATVIRPQKGYIKPDVFKKQIVEDKEVWVVIVGDNEVFVSDVINNLGVMPSEFNITTFALSIGRNMDKMDNNFLSKIKFHYPTAKFFDARSIASRNFINHYRKRFNTYPSKYAVEGFDITYDILMRLSFNSDLIHQGASERLSSKYQFIENTSNSILNTGMYIIKYDGLSLKVVQ